DGTTRCVVRFGRSPPVDPSAARQATPGIRAESYGKISGKKQRKRRAQSVHSAHRILDFYFEPLGVLQDEIFDSQSLKHRDGAIANGRIEKTVTLIGDSTQKTDDQKQRHAELLADGEQTVAGDVDASVFHIDGCLFATEGSARRNGYRFLLARRGNQVHLRIVSNQRNDLTESSFRQIGDKVDPRLFKTLNNSFCQFFLHERYFEVSIHTVGCN